VRRGSQLFWRVPHLRGSARSGVVRTRTVIWTFDGATGGRSALPQTSTSASGASTPAACKGVH
jgi:hypothetical protein